ncbi:CIA30-domain-containing protein [Calocera viscosa TUFC12733]|uniref:CIA30-domain-containing protein n=1 Tax=Calocera viscosa (strain TUFC12733) TaxID=1330018 RepID=A0A167FVQ9_CALVF|nr:CIA30-domain-containing protein [Calocera viscosa TUFC12733]
MSRFRSYLQRSLASAQDALAKTIAADPAPPRAPLPIFTMRTEEDMKQFATGCDADIGGYSTCHLELGRDGHGVFWGNMSTAVHPRLEGKMNSGYAAFRSRVRSTLFGEMYFDASRHKYLHLRVKARGDRRTRDAYFVNVQTETPITSDIWQHRLFLRGDEDWEDVLVRIRRASHPVSSRLTRRQIPFRSFVLTNYGERVQEGMEMNTEKLRTVGISILGGKFSINGEYELGIDSISAVHEAPNGARRISAASESALAEPGSQEGEEEAEDVLGPTPRKSPEDALPTPPPELKEEEQAILQAFFEPEREREEQRADEQPPVYPISPRPPPPAGSRKPKP